jgi:hypothetical protein
MATTKRTASKTAKPAETGVEGSAARAPRTKRIAQAAESAKAAPEKTTAAERKSPAATHKAPARKAKAAAAAAGPVFDASLHREEIEREAYHLWLKRGCTHGQADQDWSRAEALVRGRYVSGN